MKENPVEMRLTYLPGCDKLCMTEDKNLTPTAIESGTIIHELSIAWLDEVKAIKRDDVVFDVGAFLGDTALIFAERSDHVTAFEPQTDAFVCARYNTAGRAVIINAAVGNGEKVFCQQNPLDGNFGTRGVGLGGEVHSLRIDDLAPPRLDFLKIDCEGFEPSVILGALETLQRCHPTILVEIYGTMLARYGFTPEDVIRPLTNIGYSYRLAIGRQEDDRYDLLFRI